MQGVSHVIKVIGVPTNLESTLPPTFNSGVFDPYARCRMSVDEVRANLDPFVIPPQDDMRPIRLYNPSFREFLRLASLSNTHMTAAP